MSSATFLPFISWSRFQSQNSQKPDTLELQIAEPELFTTLYSVNVRVYEKDIDGNPTEKILPIKSHESRNSDLLKQWEKAFHKGLLERNTHIIIKIWRDISKNNFPILRYKLIIID